mmetsp:Transcript_9133/g.15132  ORF Transcript_9133/g.15132 Transcript_9133/m.15132 type:complete len:492 (+) Transcript_9133:76-1551(+)
MSDHNKRRRSDGGGSGGSREYDRDDRRRRDRDDSRDRYDQDSRADDNITELALRSLGYIRKLSYDRRVAVNSQAKNIEADLASMGKEARELFIGNVLDPNASDTLLQLFLNTAMRKLEMVDDRDEPVVRCRVSNKFSFAEFRNSYDCTRALNLSGIPFMGSNLKIGRPAKYKGPVIDTFNWQELVGKKGVEVGAGGHHNADSPPKGYTGSGGGSGGAGSGTGTTTAPYPPSKPYREIFVGNTSLEVTDQLLKDFIGAAMQKMGMAYAKNENPVYNAKVTGKFAFLEMRNSIDAANVVNLNGIPFLGTNLNIMRPTRYDGGCGIEAYYKWDDLYRMWLESPDLKQMTAGKPSRVLIMTNMASPAELASSETLYLDIMEDTRYECGLHGLVRSVMVPRGNAGPAGVGNVFVEMNSVEEAMRALVALKGRSFDGRIVDVKFYPLEAFVAMDYTYVHPPVVITASFGATTVDKVFNSKALAVIDEEKKSQSVSNY